MTVHRNEPSVTKRATDESGAARTSARARPQRVREAVRSETRAAYREAILDAAGRVFGRLGFHDAKMADIAGEAGVAAGTVYNYFKNKDEVFRSMLARGHDIVFEKIYADRGVEDPLERLRAWTRTVFTFLEEHGVLFALYVRIGGTLDWLQKNTVDTLHEQAHARYYALSKAAMAEAAAMGLLRRDVPTDELAILLSGLTDATIFAWARAGCPAGLRAKADPLFDFFLHGAKAP